MKFWNKKIKRVIIWTENVENVAEFKKSEHSKNAFWNVLLRETTYFAFFVLFRKARFEFRKFTMVRFRKKIVERVRFLIKRLKKCQNLRKVRIQKVTLWITLVLERYLFDHFRTSSKSLSLKKHFYVASDFQIKIWNASVNESWINYFKKSVVIWLFEKKCSQKTTLWIILFDKDDIFCIFRAFGKAWHGIKNITMRQIRFLNVTKSQIFRLKFLHGVRIWTKTFTTFQSLNWRISNRLRNWKKAFKWSRFVILYIVKTTYFRFLCIFEKHDFNLRIYHA